MIEAKEKPNGEDLFQLDESLIDQFDKGGVIGDKAREFALSYALLQRDHFRIHLCTTMYVAIETGINYARTQFSIWNFAVEQAQSENWTPLRLKLITEAQDLLTSEDSESERLGVAQINLASCI